MKNSKKRFLSALLVVVMLVSLFPVSALAAKSNGLVTKDGYLWVEAEDLKFDKSAFAKTKSKEMWSKGTALEVTSAVKDPAPASDEEAHIDLSFTADQRGTYAVWARNTANQVGDSGNSIYLSVGAGAAYSYQGLKGDVDIPTWTKITEVKIKEGETASIRIRTRQMSVTFDMFIITNEEGFSPVDQELGLEKLIGVPVRNTPEPHHVSASGTLVLEAEDMDFNTTSFMLFDDTEASGGKSLKAISEDKNVPSNKQTADIDVSFTAEKMGTYAVWCRARTSGDSGSNSIFFSYKKPLDSYTYKSLESEPEAYGWTKLCTLTLTDNADIGCDTGYARICRRQAGRVYIDKFIITNDMSFVPSGKNDVPGASGDRTLPELYAKPEVYPQKGEHPRLWMHKEDISGIKERMSHPQNVSSAEKSASQAVSSVTVTDKYNSGKHWAIIESKAFDYAVNGNKEHGREAIELYMELAPIAMYDGDNFAVRQYGDVVATGARVYDWCYDLMSDKEKSDMITAIEAKCYSLTIGYPPRGGYITGHNSEGMMLSALMEFAVATYDERPDIYNCIMGRFYECYVPVRNWWYQSHSYHQGTGYIGRFEWDLFAALMLQKSLHTEPFNMEDMNLTTRWIMYMKRPDGQHFRDGDDFNIHNKPGTYWTSYKNMLFEAASLFGDEYFKHEVVRCNPTYEPLSRGNEGQYSCEMFLICNDVELGEKLRDDLPLTTYCPSPNGMMIARTGWNDGMDTPDVMAYMKIGEITTNNHEHLDMGSFQLYYKGILASDTGIYGTYGTDHDGKYHKASIAHNIITVYDPEEVIIGGSVNDGGYQFPNIGGEPSSMEELQQKYVMAEVTAHEFGPDTYTPDYSYIAGDMTKAYNANGTSNKVSESLRSMVFLPLDDEEHPGALVVFDKITSTNKDFKKSWLLHMEEEPEVDGNKTIVTRRKYGNNGRMVNETLLPKTVETTKIGGTGKKFWVDGENFDAMITSEGAEAGWGRVEISPATASETDYFLNVMTVSDADTTAPDVVNTLIENDTVAGAAFAGKAVVFNRNKARITNSVSFTLPEGSYDLLVCGLTAGTWDVNGVEAIAGEDGGCVYVNGVNGGDVTLTYKNSNADKTFTANKPEVPDEKIGIRVDGGYVYSDVDPVIVNDRTLVPMRAIFEKLEADVTYDDATATATAVRDGKTVQITEGSNTAYVNGEAVELDVAATIINDRFVVPIRFVSESLGATVEWQEYAKIVAITSPPTKTVFEHKPTEKNEIRVVGGYDSSIEGGAASEDGNDFKNTLDGNFGSRLAIEGVDYDKTWVVYELEDAYSLDKIGIAFYQSNARKEFFAIEVSEDEQSWTTVIDKRASDDYTGPYDYEYFDMNGVKAKYIKIKFGGNSGSAWNSITEIKFFKK